ncbi:28824_t:CDS:2, partial [Racocetra persica]
MGTDKVMRKRTIYCQHSGQYKAKNPENPGTSVRQGLDEHNYELSVEALQFEKLKIFTKKMQDDIVFYVKKCNFGDAARFYEELLSKQQHAIIIEYPLVCHLLCIWHIKENLKKALRGKLGNLFADFYSVFWKCQNAETPDAFNYYWREMVTNYPTASEYLER